MQPLCFLCQKNYEAVISQYKKKVEDAQELRKQLKVTEDRNLMFMQKNMDLEEVGVAADHVTGTGSIPLLLFFAQELRRQSGLKKQLDAQRLKVAKKIFFTKTVHKCHHFDVSIKISRRLWHRRSFGVWRY